MKPKNIGKKLISTKAKTETTLKRAIKYIVTFILSMLCISNRDKIKRYKRENKHKARSAVKLNPNRYKPTPYNINARTMEKINISKIFSSEDLRFFISLKNDWRKNIIPFMTHHQFRKIKFALITY